MACALKKFMSLSLGKFTNQQPLYAVANNYSSDYHHVSSDTPSKYKSKHNNTT